MPEPLEIPTPNLPLLRKVLDHIDAHPEEWNQAEVVIETACGTAHCIAGHAAVMAGVATQTESGWNLGGDLGWCAAAQSALGLTVVEASELFCFDNSRTQVQRVAERIAQRGGERL